MGCPAQTTDNSAKRKTLQDVVFFYSVGLLLISICQIMNGCYLFVKNKQFKKRYSFTFAKRTDVYATVLWTATFGLGSIVGVLGIATASKAIFCSKIKEMDEFKEAFKTAMIMVSINSFLKVTKDSRLL